MRWNKNKLGCVLLVLLATGLIRVVVVLHEALADTLPPCALNKTLQLQLRVDELKRYSDTDWTGSFVVLPSVELMCQPLVDTKLRLSLRHPQPLILGQILNAQVKLKPLWGSLNVAGFDYRRWLAAKGYKATGYIQQANPLETPAVASITDRVRKRLIESDLKQASGLLALAVGDQEGLTTAHWARLRKTGTVHLFVISGLHVALVGGWLYLLLLTPLRVVAALATKPMPVQKIA
ncbi:MAG: ComEC/Rec2 family competence protein, partial [Pseudomonadota bacterium]